MELWGKEKGRIRKQLKIIYASYKISLLRVVVQNGFLMAGTCAAWPCGSGSLQAGEAQPAAVQELARHVEATASAGPGGERPAPGFGRSPSLQLASDPSLCRLGFQGAPRESQAPEVVDKAGLCPFKELWFDESRCPVGRLGGWDPVGRDANAQLRTWGLRLGTGVHP